MANTYQLISSVTVGSGGASSIAFSSIPSTYTDLLLKVSLRADTVNNVWCKVALNSSSTSFSARHLQGNGASASSYSFTDNSTFFLIDQTTDTASTFGNAEMYIPNYAGSTYKSMSIDTVNENNGTTAYSGLTGYLWSNTAAINAITLSTQTSGGFAQYSTAYLYGIKNS